MKEVTMDVPIALAQLILNNNEALKKYQSQLMQQIKLANEQMMQILKLDPEEGWQLDMERMVYVRATTPEEILEVEA
jgi:hypothetical protein